MKEQKCWTCHHAVPGIGRKNGCPWSRRFEPVPGWNAIPQFLKGADGILVSTWYILDCPMYLPDSDEVEQTNGTVGSDGYQKVLTMGGRTQTVNAWAEETGMSAQTIHRRLASGWSVEDALTIPVSKNNAKIFKRKNARKIVGQNLETDETRTWESISAAVREMGFSERSIREICAGDRFEHQGWTFRAI